MRNPEQTVEYGQPFRERGGLTSVDILAYNAREGYCDAAAMPTGEHSVLQNPRQKAADPAVRQWKPRAGRKLDWLAQLGRASSDDVPKLAGSPQLPLACDNPNQLIASFEDARRTANQAVLSTLNEEINNRCRPRHPMPFWRQIPPALTLTA